MYSLTLTKAERQAIDWIGHRYWHGDDFYKLLQSCEQIFGPFDRMVDPDSDDYWRYSELIEFKIPEHKAWEIKEGLESEDGFCSCFATELKDKLMRFIDSII